MTTYWQRNPARYRQMKRRLSRKQMRDLTAELADCHFRNWLTPASHGERMQP